MKLTLITTVLLSLFLINAQANERNHHNTDVIVAAGAGVATGALLSSCSPTIIQGNIVQTDKSLKKYLGDKRFEDAFKFKKYLYAIQKMDTAKDKIAAYFHMVGVESKEEAAYFIGARKEDLKSYSNDLADRMELNSFQADLVTEDLIESLKGSL